MSDEPMTDDELARLREALEISSDSATVFMAVPRLLAEIERLRTRDAQWAEKWKAAVDTGFNNTFEAMTERDGARAEAERWRAERNAMGLHAHEVQHRADTEQKRAEMLAKQLRLLLSDARELITLTTAIMGASATLPVAAVEQLAKAEEAANELGAWLAAQPDQIGPPLDATV